VGATRPEIDEKYVREKRAKEKGRRKGGTHERFKVWGEKCAAIRKVGVNPISKAVWTRRGSYAVWGSGNFKC